ncbi:hypothetical protein COCC4DRAFT_154659 [Bipolaris maydis ATCC 48331]|uniref:Rhodopsin domain-containing protein n=2 Tax=Cochliobolus heterostrophus TaxID=5016 RepID=M2UAG0_COCH5|nr:uncharacterized protein COCC4DRAFT_154659 [Bipolaris maydis ATCC 48331]EMD84932.1 hypothetical protein COCHEDRAFT_1120574 [Bipolaris maydis C5]KAJ5021263.1 hypothetical protein J3E73DRAFT_199813 [Bipolaris maydis]ENH98859.1 hypothetical protein COCC4DRAFT_154659 [Bipolaris maydis ATCC 48331]KAJ5025770.1 hypothetical protein J3E73DRAFT_192099 [Bipolaris maydis]KAJ6269982.1 hypothetical protein PSV08DRAFT_182709 [Bipolaris maydis]
MVGLRGYVRRKILRNLGLDDWFLLTGLIHGRFQHYPNHYKAIRYGLSRHVHTTTLPERSEFLKIMWVTSVMYGALIMILKITFLLQYRRVFPLPIFQQLCDASLVFIALWATAATLGSLLNCPPIKLNWDPLRYKDCKERLRFWYAMGILHVISDAAIFAMPLPLLQTLTLQRLQKGVLMGIFSLGFFTCAISIIRLTTLRSSTMSDDPTWAMQNTVLWSTVEVACAIICVCIPTLRPLLRRCTGWQKHSNDITELTPTPRLEEEGGEFAETNIKGVRI